MTQQHPDDPVAAVASLSDPTRKALYDYVRRQPRPVGRDEAAGAAGISRSLAAYHLDRLAASGLLDVRYERPPGRSGPGAGRPAKLYERSKRGIEVSLPARRNDLAARAFIDVVAHDEREEALSALLPAARRIGHALAEDVSSRAPEADLMTSLEALGYEPFVDAEGTIRLRNCLFDDLVEQERELTCTMTLGLIEGALEALGGDPACARLDPGDDRCCVVILGRDAPCNGQSPASPG